MPSTSSRKPRLTASVCAAILVCAAAAAIIAWCFSSGISGNDFWWHVKVGEYVVENREVPTEDIFSWYGMREKLPWTAHEWLAEVIFYLIFSAAGEPGIFVFCLAAALAMTFLLISCAWDGLRRNVLFGGLFFALFAVLTSVFFYGRPHVFGFFLLFAEVKLLYDYSLDDNSRRIWLIPLIAVLWSNLHGGSASLSYVLCAVFLVCSLFNFDLGRVTARRLSRRGTVRLAAVTAASASAIFVNPVGAKVFLYPYVNLSDKVSMSVISEWAPPDAKNIGELVLYFLPIALVALSVIASEKKVRLTDLAVEGMFLLLFFRSARFIIMWYIVSAVCAFGYIPGIRVKEFRSAFEKGLVLVCAAALVLLGAVGAAKIPALYTEGGLIGKQMTDEALDAVRADGAKRLFNDYDLGESLIAADIPVFFDARADLFSPTGVLADGVGLLNMSGLGENGVEETVSRYGFDAILVLKKRPLYTYLTSRPDLYVEVFSDDTAAYFRVLCETR